MMQPFCCPTCNGYGTVSKPPWIAGDHQTWASATVALYPCPSCKGTGTIWKEPYNDPLSERV